MGEGPSQKRPRLIRETDAPNGQAPLAFVAAGLLGGLLAAQLVGAAALSLFAAPRYRTIEVDCRVTEQAQETRSALASAVLEPTLSQVQNEAPLPKGGTHFAFRIGERQFVALGQMDAEAAEKIAVWEAARVAQADTITTMVAPADPGSLDSNVQMLIGAPVQIGHTCQGTLGSVFVVSRTWSPDDWLRLEGKSQEEKIEQIIGHGDLVMAAEVRGCDFAEDAPAQDRVANYGASARIDMQWGIRGEVPSHSVLKKLIAKTPVSEASQAFWREAEHKGSWVRQAEIEAQMYTHPVGGEQWLVIQAYAGASCGDVEINALVIYRREPGASQWQLEGDQFVDQLGEIGEAVDVDGDGEFEFVGEGALGTDAVLITSDAKVSRELPFTFHGCSC